MQKLDPERYVLLNIEVKGRYARFAVPRHYTVAYAARAAWDQLMGDSAVNEHFAMETTEGRYLGPNKVIGWNFIDEQFVKVVQRHEPLD